MAHGISTIPDDQREAAAIRDSAGRRGRDRAEKLLWTSGRRLRRGGYGGRHFGAQTSTNTADAELPRARSAMSGPRGSRPPPTAGTTHRHDPEPLPPRPGSGGGAGSGVIWYIVKP